MFGEGNGTFSSVFGNIVLARLWKLYWRGVSLEAKRLPRRLLLLFRQERSVSARVMAAVTAEKGQSQSH